MKKAEKIAIFGIIGFVIGFFIFINVTSNNLLLTILGSLGFAGLFMRFAKSIF